jgi:hypothetical protein
VTGAALTAALGCPPARRRTRKRLIERVLLYQFDAQTMFSTEPDGIHCVISLPAGED